MPSIAYLVEFPGFFVVRAARRCWQLGEKEPFYSKKKNPFKLSEFVFNGGVVSGGCSDLKTGVVSSVPTLRQVFVLKVVLKEARVFTVLNFGSKCERGQKIRWNQRFNAR